MPGALPRLPARTRALDRSAARPRYVEERDVLLPGQPDHHEQAVALRRVEQPARRHRVDAHGVDARGRHRREVAIDDLGARVVAVRVGPERPVGHALDLELLVPGIQKLAGDARPLHRRRRDARDGRNTRLWHGAHRVCQRHAVAMIVSRPECCGTQPRKLRLRPGSATSVAGSPARGAASRRGSSRPAIRSTAVTTSRTEKPRPLPRLHATLAPPSRAGGRGRARARPRGRSRGCSRVRPCRRPSGSPSRRFRKTGGRPGRSE